MGTAFEDLAGVEVGDTLFVGEPCKIIRGACHRWFVRQEDHSREYENTSPCFFLPLLGTYKNKNMRGNS